MIDSAMVQPEKTNVIAAIGPAANPQTTLGEFGKLSAVVELEPSTKS
jgi:hypothetical protein